MADSDITGLTELTTPVSGDFLVIDDTSAGGITKKLDWGNLVNSITGGSVYNVVIYGADKTGVSSSSTAIQSAVDAAELAGGGAVYFPTGDYLIDVGITIDSAGVVLVGESHRYTRLTADTGFTGVLVSFLGVSDTAHIEGCGIKDLFIFGDSKACQGLSLKYLSNFIMYNSEVAWCKSDDAWYIEECWDSSFIHCWCRSNGDNGSTHTALRIYNGALDNANHLYFMRLQVENNTVGTLIELDGSGAGTSSHDICFEQMHMESNAGSSNCTGIYNNGARNSRINGGVIRMTTGSSCIGIEQVTGNGLLHVNQTKISTLAGGTGIDVSSGEMYIMNNEFASCTTDIDLNGADKRLIFYQGNRDITGTHRYLTSSDYGGNTILMSEHDNEIWASDTIADDGVWSFEPRYIEGILSISAFNSFSGAANQTQNLLVVQCDGTNTRSGVTTIHTGADCAITTGVLTGTTGADGVMTISAHTDGKIYIENRRGFAVKVQVRFICGTAVTTS